MSARLVALLAILTANVFGGLSYYWQKLATEGIPPATVALLRNCVAIVALVALMRLLTRRRSGAAVAPADDRADGAADSAPEPARTIAGFRPRDAVRVAAIGMFGFGLPLALGNIGVELSTATNGSILILLEPVAILAFSWFLLKEPMLLGQVAGLALGLIGAYLVSVGERSPSEVVALLTESDYLRGNVILLLHGVLWGLYSPLMKPIAHRYRAIHLTLAIQVIGLVPMLPLAIREWSEWQPNAATFWPAFGHVVVLALLVSTWGTILWNTALRTLRASTVAPFVFVQPLVGTLAGMLWLDESLTSTAMVGSGAIVIAVLLVTYARPRRPAEIDVSEVSA